MTAYVSALIAAGRDVNLLEVLDRDRRGFDAWLVSEPKPLSREEADRLELHRFLSEVA